MLIDQVEKHATNGNQNDMMWFKSDFKKLKLEYM